MATEQDLQEIQSAVAWAASELKYRHQTSLIETADETTVSVSDFQCLMVGELKRAILLATRNIKHERTVYQIRDVIASYCEKQNEYPISFKNQYVDDYNEYLNLKNESCELDLKIKNLNDNNKIFINKLNNLESAIMAQKRAIKSNKIISKLANTQPNIHDSTKKLNDFLNNLNSDLIKKNQDWFKVKTFHENQKSDLITVALSDLQKAHNVHLKTHITTQTAKTEYTQLYDKFLAQFETLVNSIISKNPDLALEKVRSNIKHSL
ncbi:hypothetical protein BB561_005086 [Smittium simulii]|uniref:Uncharacterized protein n=1 Tax=Smittium simulii TaxID=133385 RepID=A0A2T9YCB7_9FUNG|nr:hypothetical protein BB561_005086 [Smittium simulii]